MLNKQPIHCTQWQSLRNEAPKMMLIKLIFEKLKKSIFYAYNWVFFNLLETLLLVDIWTCIARCMLWIVRNNIFVFSYASAIKTMLQIFNWKNQWKQHPKLLKEITKLYRSISTWWTFCSWSIGNAITTCSIKTEQLSAYTFVFETGWCSTITTTLRIQW